MSLKRLAKSLAWALADKVDKRVASHFRLVPIQRLHTLPEQEHLKRLIKHFEIDCIFDVGANRGQYAHMLRQQVGYKGHIVSFEPIPDCVASLRIAAAHDAHWHIEQIALSDHSGSQSFNVMVDSEFSSLSSPKTNGFNLAEIGNKIKETVEVKVETLEKKFEEYSALLGFSRPFLKMDTQGNDLFVARGAGPCLEKFIGLQSELAVVPIYNDAPSYVQAIEFYQQNGFSLSALVPNNAGHFPRLIEVDCIMANNRFLSA